MSLRVWLPLNGDLHNQGLSNITVTNNGATVNTSGKIGSCYEFNDSKNISLTDYVAEFLTYTNWSISLWFKCTAQNTGHTGSALISSGNWNYPTQLLQFSLGYFSSDHYTKLLVTNANSWSNGYSYNFYLNTWYHVVLVSGNNKMSAYVNGELIGDSFPAYTPVSSAQSYIGIGKATYYNGMSFFGLMNDFRIYDHALSELEIKEIARAKVLHYPLNHNGLGNENLFRGSAMTQEDQDNMVASNSTSFGETKYFRYYNGSKSNHSFSNGIDTVTLNAASNLGIAFMRPAVDIDLDSNSYYTISCRAKCTKAGAGLDIGLSYRTTADAWVWRGGSNRQLFNAVNQWQTFTLTFKPDADTKYICYCFTVLGVKNGTDTFSIKECKLEKGEIATRWALSSLDSLYNSEIYESVVEYDTSGYRNNGTKVGTFTYSTDTPKYNLSTYINATSTANRIESINDIILPTDGITASLWIKTSSKATNQVLLATSQIEIGLLNSLCYVKTSNAAGFTTTNFINNEWNHIVAIRINNTYKLYINGVEETQSGASNYYVHNKNTLYLFNRSYNNNYAANANLSDVRIYATALSAQDILSLYHNSALVDEQGIIHGAIH